MVEIEGTEALEAYLKDTVGDSLRWMLTYDQSTHEVLHVRPDVARAHSKNYDEKAAALYRERNLEHEELESALEFSNESASIRVFTEAILIHIIGDQRGVVISVDHDVGVNLVTFLNNCREKLEF